MYGFKDIFVFIVIFIKFEISVILVFLEYIGIIIF